MLFYFFLLITSINLYGQTPKDEPAVRTQEDPLSKKDEMKDCVLMKNNKVFVIIKGQMSAMAADQTLVNGDIVTKEGKVIRKDGSSKQMKNGDCITMSGLWSHYDKNEKVKTPEEKQEVDQ